MKFSIIIPAHNSEAYIGRLLASIRNQNFKDYEIIVVLDQCTDGTGVVADSYGARTEVVSFGNDGLTRSRGVDLAQGEYLMFADDDDWWEDDPTCLDAIAENTPGYDVVYFGWSFVGDSFNAKHLGYIKPEFHHLFGYPNCWSRAWRREFVGDIRFPNVYSISDSIFVRHIMEKQPKIKLLDKKVYCYNFLRPGSISADQFGGK